MRLRLLETEKFVSFCDGVCRIDGADRLPAANRCYRRVGASRRGCGGQASDSPHIQPAATDEVIWCAGERQGTARIASRSISSSRLSGNIRVIKRNKQLEQKTAAAVRAAVAVIAAQATVASSGRSINSGDFHGNNLGDSSRSSNYSIARQELTMVAFIKESRATSTYNNRWRGGARIDTVTALGGYTLVCRQERPGHLGPNTTRAYRDEGPRVVVHRCSRVSCCARFRAPHQPFRTYTDPNSGVGDAATTSALSASSIREAARRNGSRNTA